MGRAIRHPQLWVYFYEGKAGLYRRHVLIELEKARSIYGDAVALTLDETARIYMGRMKCFQNSYLYAFCRSIKPLTAVETGVHYGASSSFILQALQDNGVGHLYSIDLPDVEYMRDDGLLHRDSINTSSVGFAVPEGLRHKWTLIAGDARKELPKLLDSLESIDFFHHDSMHTYEHMWFEYTLAWEKLTRGGMLSSDDVLWNTAFTDFCREKKVEPHIVGGAGFALKV